MDSTKPLTLSWTGGKRGSGRLMSPYVSADLAMPQAHGGVGTGLSPKDILAASAAECLLLNLVAIFEASGVGHGGFSLETSAAGGGGNGISINHHLTITMAGDSPADDRLEKLINKAEAACNIGNLLKTAGVVIGLTHSTAPV